LVAEPGAVNTTWVPDGYVRRWPPRERGAALATRVARARGAYDAVGVEVIVVT
jgi:hypothetical protein